MKEEKIIKRLRKAIKEQQTCDMYTSYAEDKAIQILPVKISDKFIMFIPGADVESHGYAIRYIRDLKKIKLNDQPSGKKAKGDEQSLPYDIRLDSLMSILEDLQEAGEIVTVENENGSVKEGNYAIGKIAKLGKKRIGIRYYGPDKSWEDKKWKMPYEDITRINIASRYTNVLSEYVTEEENMVEGFEDLEDRDNEKES